MFYSMTGFGRQEKMIGNYHCIIEIKTLNGKQLELNIKIPSFLKTYEVEIRNCLQKKIQRGSVDVYITLKHLGTTKPLTVNTELAKYYYASIQTLSAELNLPSKDILNTILLLPEVVSTSTDSLEEQEWEQVKKLLEASCDKVNEHRKQEGVMLTQYITNSIDSIKRLSEEVTPFENNRIIKLREKFKQAIADFATDISTDNNRMEQEIIYYAEKLDINEEKSRLKHHCQYFEEIKDSSDIQKGKKLGFVLQEIGREINTMGSKANDADIQKLVVQMKDELEQAKEQILNVL